MRFSSRSTGTISEDLGVDASGGAPLGLYPQAILKPRESIQVSASKLRAFSIPIYNCVGVMSDLATETLVIARASSPP